MSIAIRKPYDPVVRCPAVPGSSVEDQIRLKRDADGNCVYTKVGEKDVKEYISSFAAGCSLQSMLDRCNLMPVQEKIAYLNQTEDGVSADLTHMPTDGTAAHIMLSKLKAKYPDFAQRLKDGESFDKILEEIFPSEEEAPSVENTTEKDGE